MAFHPDRDSIRIERDPDSNEKLLAVDGIMTYRKAHRDVHTTMRFRLPDEYQD